MIPMPDSNPFDMDFDGDVDGIDFLGFDHFMRHGLGRGAESAPRGDDAALDLASLIGVSVLSVTVLFACLVCILTVFGGS
jgi:hypothetical protein